MRSKKYLVTIVIFLVLVLCVGVSYSYFTSNTNNKESKLKISSKDLSIVLTDNMELNSNDIAPGWSDSKSFTIKNNSNGSYNYNIVLKDLVNTFVTEGFLQYKITSTNGYNTEGYINIPKSESPQDIVIGYDIDIEKGITQEYQIEFIYEDSEDIDQSEDMGKIFKGTLAIEEGTVNPNIKYSVTLNVDNGIIDGKSNSEVKETIKNGSVEFNIKANDGYILSNVINCDENAQGIIKNDLVTISNIKSNVVCYINLRRPQCSLYLSYTSNELTSKASFTSRYFSGDCGSYVTINSTMFCEYYLKQDSCFDQNGNKINIDIGTFSDRNRTKKIQLNYSYLNCKYRIIDNGSCY